MCALLHGKLGLLALGTKWRRDWQEVIALDDEAFSETWKLWGFLYQLSHRTGFQYLDQAKC